MFTRILLAIIGILSALASLVIIQTGIAILISVACLIGFSVVTMMADAAKQREQIAKKQLDEIRFELAKIEIALTNGSSSVTHHLRGEIGDSMRQMVETAGHTNSLLQWIGEAQAARHEAEATLNRIR